eukprot:2582511-Pleurochrysis_carterae.AAC.3
MAAGSAPMDVRLPAATATAPRQSTTGISVLSCCLRSISCYLRSIKRLPPQEAGLGLQDAASGLFVPTPSVVIARFCCRIDRAILLSEQANAGQRSKGGNFCTAF